MATVQGILWWAWYDGGYERLVRKYAAATDNAAILRMAPIVRQPTVSGMYRSAAR